MKLLFKIFILTRPKEEGFVLPVIISLGLIMTLLGTISIFQSSDEQLTASSQRETAKALVAAEIGVARYRELIDSNKVIAVYDACRDINDDGDTDDANEWGGGTTCNNPNSEVNWANSNIPNINSSCLADAATTVANMTSRAWRFIDPDNPAEGQYRLIDYTYSSTGNLGTLRVEGRVGQDNTNVSNDPLAAVTQVVVDLPIQRGIPTPNGEAIQLEGNFNNFHPALWITGDAEGVTDNTGLKVDGNIVFTDTDIILSDTDGCELTGSTVMTTDNLVDTSKQSIIVTPIQPQAKTFPLLGATNLDTDLLDIDVNIILASQINSGIILPRPGDVSEHQDSNNDGIVDPGEEVIYHYLVDGDLNLTSENIKIRAGRKVLLYVDKNITIQANGSGSSVDINSDNPSYYLEIYGGDANQTITLSGGASSGEININALIHAPNAKVEIRNDPTINITGAVWVKDWDGKSLSNNVMIKPDSQAADEISKQYYNYTYIKKDLVNENARVVDPVISVPSRWETQQAE